jgi:hypothetical protein
VRRYRKLDPPNEKLITAYLFTGQNNQIEIFAFSPGMGSEDTGITSDHDFPLIRGASGEPDHGGWVKFHRSLAEHELWLGERFTKGQAWADLLLLASHKDHICTAGNVATSVRRGQVLTSQVKLAKRWRWNRETVGRFLKLLETLEMCRIETSKRTDTGYTLITLLNYGRLQGTFTADPASDPTPDQASGQHRASTINKG